MVNLEYSPRTHTTRRRRLRNVVVVTIVLTIAICAFKWGSTAVRRVKFEYAWHKGSTLCLPADQVVYEDNWAASARLLKLPDYRPPSRILFDPPWYPHPPQGFVPPALYAPEFLSNFECASAKGSFASVFLHSRVSSRGETAVVGVDAGSAALSPEHAVVVGAFRYVRGPLSATVSGNRFDKLVFFSLHRGVSFRIYAGQCDRINASHFTIRFCVDDKEGTMDGWLRDLTPAQDNRFGKGTTVVVLTVREKSKVEEMPVTVDDGP
jgi:hypothetical protein